MKDEVTHKQDYQIFEHRFKERQRLIEEAQTYRTLLKEDLKTNFVAIPEHVMDDLGMDNQYYTNDQVLKDLLEKYTDLQKELKRIKERTLIERIFNVG
jgi:galactose-1-phosphate uridylyltransferase